MNDDERSPVDGKRLGDLTDEMMKCRRYLKGKEREAFIFRRMHENNGKHFPDLKDTEDVEARIHAAEESAYGHSADCIDMIFKALKIKIAPAFMLKSELSKEQTIE